MTNKKSEFDRRVDDFAEEVENLGKKFENGIERTEDRIKSRYDSTFGILGPLISSFLGLLFLIFIIWILMWAEGEFESFLVPTGLIAFLSDNIVLFFGAMLFFDYSSYFSRKYPDIFRWVSPLITTIGFILFVWIISHLFLIANLEVDLVVIEDIAIILLDNLETIFIIVLAISYLVFLINEVTRYDRVRRVSQKEKESLDRSKKYYGASSERTEEFKRLYRSGKDKLLGGVCGGLGEYLGIDPVILRIIWIIGTIVTAGTGILLYIIFWIIVPRNPNHYWD